MDKYIKQLIEELQAIAKEQWEKSASHQYSGSVGYDSEEPSLDFDEDPMSEFAEMEAWLAGATDGTMYEIFDLSPEQFPPSERLTEKHMADLNIAILDLWASFSFTAELPKGVPSSMVYPLLTKEMNNRTMLPGMGMIHIEFCENIPSTCPFGDEFCTCKEFWVE